MIVFGKERDYIIQDSNNVKGFFGGVGRFLSNFEVTPIYFDGLLYNATENAYMAGKTLDMEERKKFQQVEPKEARKMGKALEKTHLFRPDWYEVRYDVMATVVFDKFYRNLELRKKLIETGVKYLEESNHWKDSFWGKYYETKDNGVGENNLGKILMATREFWKIKEIDTNLFALK